METFEHRMVREFFAIACLGDSLGFKFSKKMIKNELLENLKNGNFVFITRGSSGFESICAKYLKMFKRKFPYICCYAVVYDTSQKVYCRECYDNIIIVADNDELKSFFTDYTDMFIFGDVSDLKFLLFDVLCFGLRFKIFGKVDEIADENLNEYFEKMMLSGGQV